MTSSSLDDWFRLLLDQAAERDQAIQEAHRQLSSIPGALAKVTLHRYMCQASQSCQIAVVFRLGGLTLCAVRDYKFSPGLNREVSVPIARERHTLDGDRHWPGHVHDVAKLAGFDSGASRAGMDMNCRHRRGTVFASDILEKVAAVRPGHPGAPTRL